MIAPSTGVLLAQLGSPDAPTPSAVRRFLAEFLADPRVIDLNPILWWLILHGIILRVRPKRSAALYERVWTEAGSPILTASVAQQEGLQARLGSDVLVELGMRYGNPPLADALDRLLAAGCQDVLVLPLFPQYCSATTASVFDAVAAWARPRREMPALRFVRSFAAHPAYVAAVVADVRRAGVEPTPAAPLLFSYHGIPQRYADTGDPYPQECEATSRAVAKALGLPDDTWRILYQSRFGKEPWLQPYLDVTLEQLPIEEGITSVSTITPSFVADCLETIDEVGREARETFLEAGGKEYVRVPCPNASPEFLDALAAIVRDNLPATASQQ